MRVRSNANEGSTPHNYASVLPQAVAIAGGMFEKGIFFEIQMKNAATGRLFLARDHVVLFLKADIKHRRLTI